MSTEIIMGLLLVITVIAIVSVVRRSAFGCCGAPRKEERPFVSDKDLPHYPYRWHKTIKGMKCENCALSIARNLDKIDGVWAQVNAKRGEIGRALQTSGRRARGGRELGVFRAQNRE